MSPSPLRRDICNRTHTNRYRELQQTWYQTNRIPALRLSTTNTTENIVTSTGRQKPTYKFLWLHNEGSRSFWSIYLTHACSEAENTKRLLHYKTTIRPVQCSTFSCKVRCFRNRKTVADLSLWCMREIVWIYIHLYSLWKSSIEEFAPLFWHSILTHTSLTVDSVASLQRTNSASSQRA